MANPDNAESTGKVAMIGAGVIAQSWAVAFARGGHNVSIYKRDLAAHDKVRESLRTLFQQLVDAELLAAADAATCLQRVQLHADLESSVHGACFVQESLPENLDLKVGVLNQVMQMTANDVPVASSTSTLLPSELSRELDSRERCFVAHPLNPPHLIPAVEIVTAPWTDAQIIASAVTRYRAIGQQPVVLDQEIEGFLMSRLQSALLHEAFRLLERGIASPEAIDRAVSSGLGLRWATLGPLEAVALNVPGGMRGYVKVFGDVHRRMGEDMRQLADWPAVAEGALDATLGSGLAPAEQERRQLLRNERLLALARLRLRSD